MACQRRPAANAKMLCVRAGRPWQIEIETGQKVGDYSLTLAFKAGGLVQGVASLVGACGGAAAGVREQRPLVMAWPCCAEACCSRSLGTRHRFRTRYSADVCCRSTL